MPPAHLASANLCRRRLSHIISSFTQLADSKRTPTSGTILCLNL
ncbi:hypothetical protein AB0756_02915 [Tolypothrix campylonemoides VB511288_2]|uniref:Uncharacterized protein n=2 Tax=Nostocales TaxID=1161 RepID=A0ABW8WFM8_9CYAN